MEEEKEVHVLLLGEAEVGKSTFLSRLLVGPQARPDALRDSNQPFILELKSKQGAHRLAFSDTASPTHYTQQQPNLIVFCYDISQRTTIEHIQQRWKVYAETQMNLHEKLPVLLLGLKRDLRSEESAESVMPQEAMRIASEMRVDRYAECSARTGDCWDVCMQDLLGMSVNSLRADGGKTEGASCLVM